MMADRLHYYDRDEWDDEGERVYHGTCRPVADHQVELSDWFGGNYSCKIICPEQARGGCVLLHDATRRECWMVPWMDNPGTELVDTSDVTVRMAIEDTSAENGLSMEEGYTIRFVKAMEECDE